MKRKWLAWAFVPGFFVAKTCVASQGTEEHFPLTPYANGESLVVDPKAGMSIMPAFAEEEMPLEKLTFPSTVFEEGILSSSSPVSKGEPWDDPYSSDALQFLTGKKPQGVRAPTFSRENLDHTFYLGTIVFKAPKEDVKSVEKTSEGVKVTLKNGKVFYAAEFKETSLH